MVAFLAQPFLAALLFSWEPDRLQERLLHQAEHDRDEDQQVDGDEDGDQCGEETVMASRTASGMRQPSFLAFHLSMPNSANAATFRVAMIIASVA